MFHAAQARRRQTNAPGRVGRLFAGNGLYWRSSFAAIVWAC